MSDLGSSQTTGHFGLVPGTSVSLLPPVRWKCHHLSPGEPGLWPAAEDAAEAERGPRVAVTVKVTDSSRQEAALVGWAPEASRSALYLWPHPLLHVQQAPVLPGWVAVKSACRPLQCWWAVSLLVGTKEGGL